MTFDTLYINGCSFTAGDSLPVEKSWPSLLQKLIGCELINDSRNGNSFDAINLVSTCRLVELDPEKTCVIIGLTWAQRYGIVFDQIIPSITPADIGQDKSEFLEKLSNDRRILSPYTRSVFDLDEYRASLVNSNEKLSGYNSTMKAFSIFYDNLVKYDTNLEDNQYLNYLKSILHLQSYLEFHKFNYVMIDFPGYFYSNLLKKNNLNISIFNKINKDRILDMRWGVFGDYTPSTSHPDSEQCKVIANLIYERL